MSLAIFENVIVGLTFWAAITTVWVICAIMMIRDLRATVAKMESRILELEDNLQRLGQDFGHMQNSVIRELGKWSKIEVTVDGDTAELAKAAERRTSSFSVKGSDLTTYHEGEKPTKTWPASGPSRL